MEEPLRRLAQCGASIQQANGRPDGGFRPQCPSAAVAGKDLSYCRGPVDRGASAGRGKERPVDCRRPNSILALRLLGTTFVLEDCPTFDGVRFGTVEQFGRRGEADWPPAAGPRPVAQERVGLPVDGTHSIRPQSGQLQRIETLVERRRRRMVPMAPLVLVAG